VPHGEVIRKAKEFGRQRVFAHERKQYAEIAAFEIIDGLLAEVTKAYLDFKQNGENASSWGPLHPTAAAALGSPKALRHYPLEEGAYFTPKH
jgi:hypothetical protein